MNLDHNIKSLHLISILDLDRCAIELVFETTDEMQRYRKSRVGLLDDQIVCTLFFEPSMRTRLSFESAAKRLGASIVGFSDPVTTRINLNESLADMIRMASAYANIIVMRHWLDGAAQLAADIADVPVINAGDGTLHHPTQALIDFYTIRQEFGCVSNRKIAVVGGLQNSRAAASFCLGLTHFENVQLWLINPDKHDMRPDVVHLLQKNGVTVVEGEKLENIVSNLDVLYVVRLQKERFSDITEYEKAKEICGVTNYHLQKAAPKMIVMHCLPRTEELPIHIDDTSNARYFAQAANGVPIRMALLKLLTTHGMHTLNYINKSTHGKISAKQFFPMQKPSWSCTNKNCAVHAEEEAIRYLPQNVSEINFKCRYCDQPMKQHGVAHHDYC